MAQVSEIGEMDLSDSGLTLHRENASEECVYRYLCKHKCERSRLGGTSAPSECHTDDSGSHWSQKDGKRGRGAKCHMDLEQGRLLTPIGAKTAAISASVEGSAASARSARVRVGTSGSMVKVA